MVKTFKEKTQILQNQENNMKGSRNRMEGKLDKRVKENNETTDKGKDGRKSLRGSKTGMRNLNLAKLEESVF